MIRARIPRGLRPLVLAAGALWASTGPAAAQVPTLDRVDSLITAGRYDDARADLGRWWSTRQAFDVPGSDGVRAMMLRARLQTDPAAAENDYLQIVIGHPTSPHAPEALLRLGQGLLARGEAARAAGYLRRLAADYPGRAGRATSLLWLARAENAARNQAAGCRAAREGLADAGSDADLAAMLRLEEAATCNLGSASTPTPGERPADPGPAPETTAATGSFAVQAGAFRYREGADALAARLRDAGFEPRFALVPSNALLRIRVGRFATAADAARLAQRLKNVGFDAVVVGDADQERTP